MIATTTVDAITQVNTLATHTALTVWNFAGDFVIIIALFTIFFYYGWYVGRGQLVAILLAFYAGYAVYAMSPFMDLLPTAPPVTALAARIGLYLALSFVFLLILRRVVVSDFLSIGIIGLMILSFLGTGFLFALAYHVFPISGVYQFTPAIDMLFAPNAYFFWWFIGPAIGLFFFAH